MKLEKQERLNNKIITLVASINDTLLLLFIFK